MTSPLTDTKPDPRRDAVSRAYLEDETQVLERLLPLARLNKKERNHTEARARKLVEAVRAGRRPKGGLDAFLQEYDLSNEEGVLLMCLAEALLRIPDADTADRLIRDKIAGADWRSHLGHSSSALVNASTWGLMLTGRVVGLGSAGEGDWNSILGRLVAKSGEPIIRQAVLYAMRIMGRQFVLGRTIKEALRESRAERARGVRFSFDMLGEAARTMPDADRYFNSYAHAVDTVAEAYAGEGNGSIFARPSISVKLSALHPRFEEFKAERLMDELRGRLLDLVRRARTADVALTVDSEEADRLDLTLDLFENVFADAALDGWEGFGLAVQAYQKRALPVIDWLAALARQERRRIPVRLVKGAYWDTEIKRHQVLGAAGYPVFTRKVATDVSYLACARRLLEDAQAFYPQFASHNAHSVAAIDAMAPNKTEFEYQRLHGMGQPLYDEVLSGGIGRRPPLRIYAPVGNHEDLLAYLVRRLLENGANSSFVHRLANDAAPIEEIIADPADEAARTDLTPHPRIPLPERLYADRKNAVGPLLADRTVRADLMSAIASELARPFEAGPVIGGELRRTSSAVVRALRDPSDCRRAIGSVAEASESDVDRALTLADAAAHAWDGLGGGVRADILDKAAGLMEERLPRLMALCVREAGKTLPNALADVREAVDFLRYYAVRARTEFAVPQAMPGPTGERNELSLHGRGVFACIAPWNFPVAIFTGQVAAALAAGNAVAAKPAEQTPLAAHEVIRLLHDAGVPGDVLHFLPGEGGTVGAALTRDPRVVGVAFTGSTETARAIQRALAERPGPIGQLIAETGGQNAMIVDSSALPEQVTVDVLASAFDSAGQRCSALRVLFLQADVADKMIAMIVGAMRELVLGDPMDPATDVGPVIDREAQSMLERHGDLMSTRGRALSQVPLPDACAHGTFFPPTAVEIDSIGILEREVFGPFLHVVRYEADKLDAVCDAINATGYGLTLGIHSRIEERVEEIVSRVHVGNIYVNRNQIGAVVGTQPFGGEGLSGTGPKAGGPQYLHRFAVERSLAVDTTASGGNAALMSLEDDKA